MSHLLDTGDAPSRSVDICGFDTDTAQMMMCCPKELVIQSSEAKTHQPPRFPDLSGNPRPVGDKTLYCSHWKEHGACALDRNFEINGSNIGVTFHVGSEIVSSQEMFSFMQVMMTKMMMIMIMVSRWPAWAPVAGIMTR